MSKRAFLSRIILRFFGIFLCLLFAVSCQSTPELLEAKVTPEVTVDVPASVNVAQEESNPTATMQPTATEENPTLPPPSPLPTNTSLPTHTPQPSSTSTNTPLPTATDTATPQPTATFTPVPPTPTATPVIMSLNIQFNTTKDNITFEVTTIELTPFDTIRINISVFNQRDESCYLIFDDENETFISDNQLTQYQVRSSNVTQALDNDRLSPLSRADLVFEFDRPPDTTTMLNFVPDTTPGAKPITASCGTDIDPFQIPYRVP